MKAKCFAYVFIGRRYVVYLSKIMPCQQKGKRGILLRSYGNINEWMGGGRGEGRESDIGK